MRAGRAKTELGGALVLAAAFALAWTNLDALAVRFGGTFGIPVSTDTFWLPKSIRLGLSNPVPAVTAGPIKWVPAREGFDIAWLDAVAAGDVVDRIALARIDPALFRFEILQDPSGRMHLDDWMHGTGALLVMNASYYGRDGKPATPVVSGGILAGPPDYQSQHGAFIVKGSRGEIQDLKIERWQDLFAGAEAGLVSYPLLIAPNGSKRTVPSQWLANRSFLAEDSSGRILAGTTQSAFFSLDRLADFLKASLPDLQAALNLDGGPVASQGIAAGHVQRKVYGRWELQAENGEGRLLPISIFMTAPMPVVIAVFKRN